MAGEVETFELGGFLKIYRGMHNTSFLVLKSLFLSDKWFHFFYYLFVNSSYIY